MYENNFTEKDWKLFQEKIPFWQENYMEKILKDYKNIIAKKVEPSKRYWELNKRIKSDEKNPGVLIVDLNRSNFFLTVVELINDGVISIKDLSEFSDLLKESVEHYINV